MNKVATIKLKFLGSTWKVSEVDNANLASLDYQPGTLLDKNELKALLVSPRWKVKIVGNH